MNGPEWCLDKQGAAVVFTVLDKDNVPQVAMTRLGAKGAEPAQILTSGAQRSFSPFGTLWAEDGSAWLAFAHGGRGYADYFVRLFDAARPARRIFAVLAAPTPKTYARTDTSIWLLGLGNDPQRRIVRRVDDGGVTGKKDHRYEPETSSGTGEIFVYYTVDKTEPGKPAIHGLRRCRTGVFASGATSK
jgi:hypothetical protein